MNFNNVIQFINSHSRFIITAHETPDGDAIGSECALYLALKLLGKDVRVINADQHAEKYDFLTGTTDFEILEEIKSLDNLEDWCLLILDTNDIHNIGEVRDMILKKVESYFIIDHHESEDLLIEENHIESNASSTCEILFRLFEQMNIEITPSIAEALFTGIVYDTGSFVYPKTTVTTFTIATKLVAAGVIPNKVYQQIYESNSISSLKLQSRVMATLELLYDQHVAVQTMLKNVIEECGASYQEADTIINFPLKGEDVKVSIFLKENEKGVLRCSLRSKGDINVAEIAQFFGGGGHKNAAGFKSLYPLDVIKKKVLDMVKGYFIN